MNASNALTESSTAEPIMVRAGARAPQWVMPLVKALLVLADLIVAGGCFVIAYWLRESKPIWAGPGLFNFSRTFLPYAALIPFVLVIRLVFLKYYGLYRLRGEFSFVDEGLRIFKAVAIGSLLIVATAFLYRGGTAFRSFSYARAIFVVDFGLALALYTVLHFAARTLQMWIRQRGINLIPTLVVGRGREAELCIREMQARRSLGYRVIGVIEAGDRTAATEFEGVPVIGGLNDLSDAIREAGANEVIITDPNVPPDTLFEVMMAAGRRRGIEFRVAPNLFTSLPHKTEVDQIGALPMLRLFTEPLSDAARITKRIFDVIVAGIVTVLLVPFWILIAVLIKLGSRGPVFYRQERIGMDGRRFMFIKFRTMTAGNDDTVHQEYLKQYIAGEAETNLGDDAKPVFKLKDDARVTGIGRYLRRLSLDELPQLFNVLRGDMSIVGPRPPIQYEVEAYETWHRRRLDMKPGITGLWQVSGRNRLKFDEMVRLDVFYIENWSLLLDLKIIALTLPVMLRGDGAH
jgi:exopolysaccharide biosynthesis polyprenyl glycosylphosphotransferase